MKIIHLIIILAVIVSIRVSYSMQFQQKNNITELVVVFKKGVSETQAESVMKTTTYSFRSGMDSSKGKAYFYSTGPKFIVTIPSGENSEIMINKFQAHPDVFEIYRADWNIRKD